MNAKRIASLVTVVLALFIFAFALTACQECEHVWEAATCTLPQTCSICNKTEGAPAGHTVVVDMAVAPTCTSTGLTEGTHCSTCGEVLTAQAFLDKTPHTEQIKEGYAPTCLRDGLSDEIKCGVCHEVIQEQTLLPMVECNYVEVVTPNLCISEGYSTFTCSFCSDSYIDNYTPAAGHSYTEWTTNGSRTVRNCENFSNCGTYQEIVALSATYVGDTLFVGEKINVNNIKLNAVLTDKTSVSIDEFVIDKDFDIADGDNYIEVSFMTLSCKVVIPAIHDNLPGSASDVEFAYHTLNKNTEVMIDGYNGTDTEVVIPSYIVVGGVRVPVRYIGDSAFKNKKITKVVIPPSVKQIESYAFQNCTALKEVDLGSVEYISDSAFRNCSSLSFIEIPASVFSLRPCFEGCTSLERVVLNEGLQYIGENTFANCPIKTIVIPNSVRSIGARAFNGCTKLTSAVIGNLVEAINTSTFQGCYSLENVVIGSSVKYIEDNAFSGCTFLRNVTIIKGELLNLNGNSFPGCSFFKRIFYTGTEKDWRKIMIYDEGVYPLTCETPYFYSESKPTEDGNYWFYSNEGMPVIWNLTDKAIEADTYTYEFIREHVGRSDSLTYDTYYDMLEDPAFMLTFGLYETLDFLVDPTDGAKKLTLTKKELYEVAIYDVLIMSVKEGDEEEKPPVWEQCATTIQEYVDGLKNFLYPDESKLENIEFAAELLDTLTGSSMFSNLSDSTVGKIKDIGEKYENAYDALNAIGRYLALMEASENFRLILLDISNNSSNPLALRSAAEDVADCLNDSFIEVIGKIIEGNVYEKIDDMLSEIVNKAWDKLLNNILPGFTTAVKGVQLFMKATLNMDEASMAFYQVSAAANFEIALRRLLINTPDFLRWSGEDHVAKHNDIVLLYKNAMMKGFDYCRDFYDKCTTDDMNLADIDMKKVERELSYDNFEVYVQEKCDSYKNIVESYS